MAKKFLFFEKKIQILARGRETLQNRSTRLTALPDWVSSFQQANSGSKKVPSFRALFWTKFYYRSLDKWIESILSQLPNENIKNWESYEQKTWKIKCHKPKLKSFLQTLWFTLNLALFVSATNGSKPKCQQKGFTFWFMTFYFFSFWLIALSVFDIFGRKLTQNTFHPII